VTSTTNIHPEEVTGQRVIASGRVALLGDKGRVLAIVTPDEADDIARYEGWEGRTCSLCDAVGHGYPGAGPCPLEDRGWADQADDDGWRF
jgi:hypothetical protein